VEIRRVTHDEEVAFLGHADDAIRDLFGGFVDGKPVAMAGVMRDPRYHGSMFEEEGRWIGFLSLAPDVPPLGAKAVRAMRAYLREQHEDIVVMHDHGHPLAEKLLRVLGFRPTDKFEADFRRPSSRLRIWRWQQSPRSQP
jgi:hypothetical protein